jgi:hypothetical protein
MVHLKRSLLIREFDQNSANMRWHNPKDVREIISTSINVMGIMIDPQCIPDKCCERIAKITDRTIRNEFIFTQTLPKIGVPFTL